MYKENLQNKIKTSEILGILRFGVGFFGSIASSSLF